jgi:internalin A
MLKEVPMKGIFVSSNHISDDGIRMLRDYSQLETVYVNSEAIGDGCVDTLTQLPALQKLQIHSPGFTSAGVSSLIDGLAQRVELDALTLSGCRGATDESLNQISRLKSLRSLSLNDNPGITSIVFREAGKLKALKILQFGGARLDESDVEHLSGLGLTQLSLANTQLTDKSIELIASYFPDLEHLDLSGSSIGDSAMQFVGKLSKLDNLSLSNTAIGNQGVASLSQLTDLRWLYLSQTAVGDRGIASLNRLKKLKYLYVNSTAVTPQGAQAFQQSHPETKVRSE